MLKRSKSTTLFFIAKPRIPRIIHGGQHRLGTHHQDARREGRSSGGGVERHLLYRKLPHRTPSDVLAGVSAQDLGSLREDAHQHTHSSQGAGKGRRRALRLPCPTPLPLYRHHTRSLLQRRGVPRYIHPTR